MINPVGERVAVVDPPAEQQRESGIIVPVPLEEYHVGIVIKVGDTGLIHSNIQEGDKVYYPASCAKQIGDTKIVDIDCIIALDRED